jgi:hypothetical protein
MQIQVLLELSEKSLKLCGISLRIVWNVKQLRSIHKFWEFFKVRKEIKSRKNIRFIPPNEINMV